ncbi:unnamed protein product [Lampetra fluviatilis]
MKLSACNSHNERCTEPHMLNGAQEAPDSTRALQCARAHCSVHAQSVQAQSVHAQSVHAQSVHAQSVHAQSVHARVLTPLVGRADGPPTPVTAKS